MAITAGRYSTTNSDGDGNHTRELPSCIRAFAEITTTMKAITEEMKGVRQDVKDNIASGIKLEESVRGLWHEVRDEIKPNIKEMSHAYTVALMTHATECPARRKAMRIAETQSATDITTRLSREDVTDEIIVVPRKAGRYQIPRPVVWIGALIGAAIAASGYITALFK